jgi:3-methyl-2-oxobutanoate hydroxymethyltransferase
VEGVKPEVAAAVTAAVKVPTIGIAAGEACDGEIRVTEDLLGITPRPPGFVAAEDGVKQAIRKVLGGYAETVKKR